MDEGTAASEMSDPPDSQIKEHLFESVDFPAVLMLADDRRAARLRPIALEVDDAANGALLIGEVSIHEGRACVVVLRS
ncbi:hypothetical protein CBA19CS22_13585 [Caballeronia novacaledonica]|uniref:Uncharacterized protein n=1 Tax=Caballeronia novacaledonica TaxID=1544861 RepID=A0ACB5QRM4_9BURK|nr:hypothetical protein CBA19CS22_13585 [Caballeronia novacaledonica]